MNFTCLMLKSNHCILFLQINKILFIPSLFFFRLSPITTTRHFSLYLFFYIVMSFTNSKFVDEVSFSTVRDNISSQDLVQKDVRNYTHPWGINPISHLEEVRQQSRINKFLTLKKSITSMTQLLSSNTEQDHIHEITNILDNLKIKRVILSSLDESDTENATKFGKEIIMIITDLLLRVVNQIGQTNVRTPTLESILAYIRSLMHTRSAHMRQTIPGPLLITWYELSHLMSSMQNEPELRMTNKKARQLINIAHDTAAWTHKYLSTELPSDDQIGFIDRSSISYTYE
jgi:hypothetical protein